MDQDPLLRTKLHIPTTGPGLVSRPRLTARLDAGARGRLTLVSAPAGFGKTTLLAEWAAATGREGVAWLSLDEADSDLTRFLTYLLAALRSTDPSVGQAAQAMLQVPEPPPPEVLLTSLINDLAAMPRLAILVLDDYHTIESRAVDRAVAFLVDHLPPPAPGLHLVIAGRADPALPLSRLRALGQLTEVRAGDLRFSMEETAAFLRRATGLPFSSEELSTLERSTEGWIAGLQLAAVAMQGLESRDQRLRFVRSFGGSHRYVIDYLLQEVLERQPPQVKEFLLQTAILERMTAPLCDAVRFGSAAAPSDDETIAVRFGSAAAPSDDETIAVRFASAAAPSDDETIAVRFGSAESRSDNVRSTGRLASQAILEELETANLFIVPLDDERRWYRYHHLFGDLLRQRLERELPGLAPELHRRASRWHGAEGHSDAAFHHARASGDVPRATYILEEHWQEIVHRGELTRLRRMLDALGAEITRQSPPLSMAYCWIHALQGAIDPIPGHLRDIQEAPDGAGPAAERRPTRLAVIPSLVETMQAIVALEEKQAGKAKDHARRAIALIPAGADLPVRWLLHGAAGYRLAEAHLALGESEQACAVLLEVLEMLRASHNHIGAAATATKIATLYQESGANREAIAVCEDALCLLEEQHLASAPPGGLLRLVLAELQAESGKVEAAQKNLQAGRSLVAPILSPPIQRLLARVEAKLDQELPDAQDLVEPLSQRELEVLQLLAEGLSNREIGERLFLALSTVKGHNGSIFGKLGAQRRTEAVARARELNLL